MARLFLVPGVGKTSLQLTRFLLEACDSLGIPARWFRYNPKRLRGLPEPAARFLSKWALVRSIRRFKPTLLLAVKADTLSPTLLGDLRTQFKIPLANWWIDDPLLRDISFRLSPAYDHFFTSDPASIEYHRRAGAKRVDLLTFACAPGLHRAVPLSTAEQTRFGSDVAFVGEISPERKAVLGALAGFDLKIWSKRAFSVLESGKVVFKDIDTQDPAYRQYTGRGAYGQDLVRVFNATKINLNLHSQEGDSTNMRSFEITGCGGFLLADRRAHLETLFTPGQEYEQFESADEMKEKIRFYLTHDSARRAIAKKGYERAHRQHTYAHRLKEILLAVQSRE